MLSKGFRHIKSTMKDTFHFSFYQAMCVKCESKLHFAYELILKYQNIFDPENGQFQAPNHTYQHVKHGYYLCHGGVDGVGCADSAEASEWEVVVEDEDLLRVVEALHVLTRLRVVGAPRGEEKIFA